VFPLIRFIRPSFRL